MDKKTIIKVQDVDVSFYVHAQGVNSFKQWLFSFGTKKLFQKKKVLEGISFEINEGDCVGFLGKNGSGKSTILKTIAGIIPPEKGKVEVHGKVAPMLAIGVGLEPELSGYENIKIGCSLMGMGRSKIGSLMDSIVEFSELSNEDLKMQVKRYSSGMKARLGFSMAVSEQPEILIVDEALSVGDQAFKEKCNKRIDEIREKGSTILFVSHSLGEVQRICNKAILLHKGKLIAQGLTKDIINKYNNS
ncbi:ABC transporter ATP-binding protein [Cytophagaceae bacterium ABcell3]|nr:ABC transporter ATP-binding protein [Cytophagaceae bacterium ABcell3]